MVGARHDGGAPRCICPELGATGPAQRHTLCPYPHDEPGREPGLAAEPAQGSRIVGYQGGAAVGALRIDNGEPTAWRIAGGDWVENPREAREAFERFPIIEPAPVWADKPTAWVYDVWPYLEPDTDTDTDNTDTDGGTN
jgi:hypothetical protein